MRGAQPRTSSHMLSFQENASLFYANSQVSQTAMRKTDLPRRNGSHGNSRVCRQCPDLFRRRFGSDERQRPMAIGSIPSGSTMQSRQTEAVSGPAETLAIPVG